MDNIPGWPSLTEPDFECARPEPMPGNISDFDDEISRFYNRIEDARAQIRRNRDAQRIETADIGENERYIARLQRMMAELSRKGKKIDATFQANIESAQASIAESQTILGMLPGHEALWQQSIKKCQPWLTWLRKVRKQGISSKTGQPRLCGFKIPATGQPCQNSAHFRDKIGWRYCTIDSHKH